MLGKKIEELLNKREQFSEDDLAQGFILTYEVLFFGSTSTVVYC